MAKTVLMYHQVASVPEIGAPFRGLNVAPENFKSQMQWLARLGHQGLSLRELAPYINGEKQGRVVGITFDDGFENVHKHAFPILSEFGFTVTCFFVSGEIGGITDGMKLSESRTLLACRRRRFSNGREQEMKLEHIPLTMFLSPTSNQQNL